MKVVAYDPFLSEEIAPRMGVEKVELDELLARADFITLHVPLTDQTRNHPDAVRRWRRPRRACGSSTVLVVAWWMKKALKAEMLAIRPCRGRGL